MRRLLAGMMAGLVLLAGCAPGEKKPDPAPTAPTAPPRSTERRATAFEISSRMCGLSVGLGSGWSQALPQRKKQVMWEREPCRVPSGTRASRERFSGRTEVMCASEQPRVNRVLTAGGAEVKGRRLVIGRLCRPA